MNTRKKTSGSRHTIFLFVVLLLSQLTLADEYAVVVNTVNPYDTVDISKAKKDVRLYYLKNQNQWPHKEKVKAYGLPSSSAGQLAFNDGVLNMSDSELTQHWLNKKQTTGETPPKPLKSDRAVLTLVSKRPGAFGIVSLGSTQSLPAKVKVLFTF
ncbi:hypothetical protein [Agarilytica rhodophyticola]|uniref:hypothetical protein n=1 Tax=Agarilytica rhodophyticola TaxID=1737490 RepID=UPI000CD947A9|nr:hypothetical protein [Agarilytica rhodophyticola]